MSPESTKQVFKPALTANWLSGKGLGGLLNCGRARFPVIRFAATRLAGKDHGQFRSKPNYLPHWSLELDPAKGTLSRNGTRVKLQDLPFRLLVLLVERQGEIVTREDVRRRLWPEDTFVEFDNSLGVAVRKLREALHDDADTPRFVENRTPQGLSIPSSRYSSEPG